MLYLTTVLRSELTYIQQLIDRCCDSGGFLDLEHCATKAAAEILVHNAEQDAEQIYTYSDAEYLEKTLTYRKQFNLYADELFAWVLHCINEHDVVIADIQQPNAERPCLVDPDARTKPASSLSDQIADAIDWIKNLPNRDRVFPGILDNPGGVIRKHMPLLYEKIDKVLGSKRELARLTSNHKGYSIVKGYGEIPVLLTPIGSVSRLAEYV